MKISNDREDWWVVVTDDWPRPGTWRRSWPVPCEIFKLTKNAATVPESLLKKIPSDRVYRKDLEHSCNICWLDEYLWANSGCGSLISSLNSSLISSVISSLISSSTDRTPNTRCFWFQEKETTFVQSDQLVIASMFQLHYLKKTIYSKK